MYRHSQVLILALTVMFGGCGGGSETNEVLAGKQATYVIGGVVTGLGTASLTLSNRNISSNTAETLIVLGTGASEVRFTFSTALPAQTDFAVSVVAPFPANLGCSVVNASGRINSVAVTNIQVNCMPNTYTVSGTVTNLVGSGLRLRNNGGDTVEVSPEANAPFTFSTALSSGVGYAVTVLQQPVSPHQTCTPAANASGPSIGSNITGVIVNCTTNTYFVGGSISGLDGNGLQLRNNDGEVLSVNAGSTRFTFITPIASGSAYNVTVHRQPQTPAQICTVSDAAGTVINADIQSTHIGCIGNVARFAYVVNKQSRTISQFNVNAITGALSPMSAVSIAVPHDADLAELNAEMRRLYVLSTATRELTVFAIDSGSGVLLPLTTTAINVAAPHSVGINSLGSVLYVVGKRSFVVQTPSPSPVIVYLNEVERFSLGGAGAPSSMGVSTVFGSNSDSSLVSGFFLEPGQQYAYLWSPYLNSLHAFSVLPNGSLSASTSMSTVPIAESMAFSPNGAYVFISRPATRVIEQYSIGVSGALSANGGSVAAGSGVNKMAVDREGRYLYALNANDATISQFRIEVNGVLTPLSPATRGTNTAPSLISVDTSGRFVYVTDSTSGTISHYAIGNGGALAPATTATTTPNNGPVRMFLLAD